MKGRQGCRPFSLSGFLLCFVYKIDFASAIVAGISFKVHPEKECLNQFIAFYPGVKITSFTIRAFLVFFRDMQEVGL